MVSIPKEGFAPFYIRSWESTSFTYLEKTHSCPGLWVDGEKHLCIWVAITITAEVNYGRHHFLEVSLCPISHLPAPNDHLPEACLETGQCGDSRQILTQNPRECTFRYRILSKELGTCLYLIGNNYYSWAKLSMRLIPGKNFVPKLPSF